MSWSITLLILLCFLEMKALGNTRDKKRQYIRAEVILSTLMATFYLQNFLLAGSFWKVFISSLTWHCFNLEGSGLLSLCSRFLLPSQNWCYFSATLANAFSKNVLSKTGILIIPSEADGLVPPAPPLLFQNKFSSWPNSLDFALAF